MSKVAGVRVVAGERRSSSANQCNVISCEATTAEGKE